MSTVLAKLQEWYRAQCDGDWEHSFGVSIGTLDNPGWVVKIDLAETILADDDSFVEVREMGEGAKTWIHCRVVGTQFEGVGDPTQLERIIEIFLRWAQERPDWLSLPPDTTQDDLEYEFWESLGEETGPEPCRRQGCERKRIAQSVLCRPHHYMMIRGTPCPFEQASTVRPRDDW